MALRSASLCAGIGGLDVGVSIARPDHRLVVAVERQAYCAAVLVARMGEAAMDSAPIWSDLATFDGRPWRGAVDLVTAGYPCQPESLAGKRGGISDERWLWHEVWRVVREMGPRYLFLENVPGHLSGTFGRVVGDMAALGWRVEWDCIPAASVGAPHLRDRLFILAANPERDELRNEHGGAMGRTGKVRPGLDTMARHGLLPTPTAQDSRASGAAAYSTDSGRHAGVTLTDAVVRKLLPTPVASAASHGGPNQSNGHGVPTLIALAATGRLPTPRERDSKGLSLRPHALPNAVGHRGRLRLSPLFVEWMMGLPLGWTDVRSALRTASIARGIGSTTSNRTGQTESTHSVTPSCRRQHHGHGVFCGSDCMGAEF